MNPRLCLSRKLCPGTRPFCCLPTTHPTRLPREQRAQPAQPHSLADPAEALQEVLGEGREPEEGKEAVGAGLQGTGPVAGRQLAGEVVLAETTSSLGLERRGRRGEGQRQPGCI